ncbi:MAG: M20/M25/M40 family metallo-hydrolase [Deltaproteobacteria bacterium]|nr:M20/M25/M40 family metallo-hydrolase [Deltaproteobacteria bacterium]
MLLLLACVTADNGADPLVDDTATPPGGDTAAEMGGADPLSLAAEVSEAEILATITDLAALGTRHSYSEGDELAAAYLVDRLEAYGLVVDQLPFEIDEGVTGLNLVARKEGVESPSVVYAFSAHYDSTSDDPLVSAPGADDNASGVAAVLEAARILSSRDTRASAWFVLTAGEEQGALGSLALAEAWQDEGADIRGVIAPDMMAYWPLGDGDAFDILGDEASEPLVNDMARVADELGVANKTWIEHRYCYGDDHTYYQDAGFPAISPMDCVEAHNVRDSGEDTPHYHKTTDTVDTLYLPFTARVTQVTTVTFAGWVGLAE